MVKVLVCIPTYNGAHRLDLLLQSISIKTNNDIDYKIVICDDSGKGHHQEKTKTVANRWSSNLPVSILINNNNLGVAKSWNRMIESEDSQHVILINDDVTVTDGWLENMLYFLDNNPNAGVAYYDFIQMEESKIQQLFSYSYESPFDHLAPVRCMHYVGCFFGFSRDKYNLAGKFDENYFANFEETDFCTTLASKGYPSHILRCPMCLHTYSATFKSAPEMNYSNIFKESKQYYEKKWDGDRETITRRYMSKIPFQKVKWIYNGETCEEILTDDHGYFQININNGEVNIAT
jgi:GT2 family glycosyltransferase